MAEDPNKNWFADFHYGQMTGQGFGAYGQIGNTLYQQEQQQKAEAARAKRRADREAAAAHKARKAEQEQMRRNERAAEQRARQQRKQPTQRPPATSAGAPPIAPAAEKPWSTLAAIAGFILGAGLVYSEPNPDGVAAVLAGAVGAGIAGRFYRVILALAALAFVLYLFAQS